MKISANVYQITQHHIPFIVPLPKSTCWQHFMHRLQPVTSVCLYGTAVVAVLFPMHPIELCRHEYMLHFFCNKIRHHEICSRMLICSQNNSTVVPASRKRRQKGNPVLGGITGPPCSWGDINTGTWPSRLGESQMRQ
jgi:hypothetical protein